MINFLHSISNVTIAIVIILAGLFFSTAIPCYVRWKFNLNPSEHFAKGAEEGFKLFTSITLLLIAFSLVRVQGDHRNVEDLVSRESAIIVKLNRALISYGGRDAAELRVDLKEYASSLVEDEWPKMSERDRSEASANKLIDITQGVRLLDPKSSVQQLARSEILIALTQLSDVREARLSASHLELPFYLSEALTVSILMLIVFGWFQNPLPKMVAYVGGVTIGVGLLLTLLIVLEGIFLGESRVSSEPIARILPLLGP
jgi:hypothetical protein